MAKKIDRPCRHATCPDDHCRRPKKDPTWRAKPKPMSDKRSRELAIYRKERIKYLADHPTCEARLEGCTNEADQIHHSRGRIGELLTDARYFKAVCGNCHRIIETRPALAKELGLSISRLNKAS